MSVAASYFRSTSSPTARDIDLFEVADNFSVLKNSHFLKAGADILYNRLNVVFPAALYGTYSFSSLANFQTGNCTTFAQAFGKTDWFQTNPNLGWFVQDEWRPRTDLTINVGLRHDAQWLDAGIVTRALNFSPRVGLAFAPGTRKTVIREASVNTTIAFLCARLPMR
jgi:outer membrane receptor protein involved in Fe transport